MSFSVINAPSGPLFDRLQILKLNDMFQLQVASLSMNVPITLPLYILEIILPESTLSMGLVLANLWKTICMLFPVTRLVWIEIYSLFWSTTLELSPYGN